MASPRKPQLPVWTVQIACLSQALCLLMLTVAIICGRDIPQGMFLGLAALCTLENGLMLGVPGKIIEGVTVAIAGVFRRDK